MTGLMSTVFFLREFNDRYYSGYEFLNETSKGCKWVVVEGPDCPYWFHAVVTFAIGFVYGPLEV